MLTLRAARLFPIALIATLLAGCGVQQRTSGLEVTNAAGITGRVHGGQQPVSGSTIQLYTVGTSGDGSASAPLLTQTVTTDAHGNFTFNFPNAYSCTSATQVYVTATGGNPLTNTPNPNLAMMTALGPCSALTSGTFIMINEVTTVAAVSALAPFMTGPTAVGSGSTDIADLTTAFTLASELADSSVGTSPGPNVPANTAVPSAEIYTLADILAACINSSGGAAGSNTNCGSLFTLTTPINGTAPSNTITALVNIQQNSTVNTSSLFALGSSTGPFQPQLAMAPADLSVSLTPLSTSPAYLTLSPTSLTFTTEQTGYPAPPLPVTVTNSGPGAITISSYSIVGTDAADFAIYAPTGLTSYTPCPFGMLASSATCTLQIRVTPSVLGPRSAYLKIVSNAPDSPKLLPLFASGSGATAGPVSVSPTSLSFTMAGSTEDVTLTNNGTHVLSIRNIAVSNSAFSISANNCGASLLSLGTCTVSVTSTFYNYSGSNPPTQSATLSFTTDSSSAVPTVSLSSQDTSYFSVSEPGASSSTGAITFTQGNPHWFAMVSGTVTGTNADNFSLNPLSCYIYGSAGSIQPPCIMTISFFPSGPGIRTAKYLFGSAPWYEYVPLTGGAAAGPSFLVTFPNGILQGIAGEPLTTDLIGGYGPQTVTIQNTGSTTLSFGYSLSGTGSDQVTVDGSACASLAPAANSLAPASTCSLVVNLIDGPVISAQPNLIIRDIASGVTSTSILPISRVANHSTYAPSYLDLGRVPAYQSSNPAAPVVLGDLVLMPQAHTYTASLPAGSSYALSGGSTCVGTTASLCSFSVIFNPTTVPAGSGEITETLTITDVTAGTVMSVPIIGFSFTSPLPPNPIAFSLTEVQFPPQRIGSVWAPVTVTVQNVSAAPVYFSGISFSSPSIGASANSCAVMSYIPANGTCLVTLYYSPSASGRIDSNIFGFSIAPNAGGTSTEYDLGIFGSSY